MLQETKISELRDEYRDLGKAFIVTQLIKLLHKSPLQYSLVRNMSRCKKKATEQEDCKTKMKRILYSCRLIAFQKMNVTKLTSSFESISNKYSAS